MGAFDLPQIIYYSSTIFNAIFTMHMFDNAIFLIQVPYDVEIKRKSRATNLSLACKKTGKCWISEIRY